MKLKNIQLFFKKLFASIKDTSQECVSLEGKVTPEDNYLFLLISKMLADRCFDKSISQSDFTKTLIGKQNETNFFSVLKRLKKMVNLPTCSSEKKTNGYFTLHHEGFEYQIHIMIEANDRAFKIHIKEIGEYTEKEPLKTIKRSTVNLVFPARSEYITKNTVDPKKWSIIVFFIVLIGGSIVIMITPDADIWGVIIGSVVLPATIYFMIIYNNMQQNEIYVAINNNSLSLYNHIILEIKFDKLKKIELIRDYKNGRLLSIKFNTKNSLLQGSGLKSEMFDLEPILQQLKRLDSIPQDIWTEKTIIVKKKYHRIILFSILFLLIIICILLYLSGNL